MQLCTNEYLTLHHHLLLLQPELLLWTKRRENRRNPITGEFCSIYSISLFTNNLSQQENKKIVSQSSQHGV